jgi:hypothetical protein
MCAIEQFPQASTLGSLGGQGLDPEIVHRRKRLLENWLNEAVLSCPGDTVLLQFLDRSQAIPDAQLDLPDDFEIVMVTPGQVCAPSPPKLTTIHASRD